MPAQYKRQPRSSSSSTSVRYGLPLVLSKPPVVARLLNYLYWPAFRALLNTSRHFRGLFSDPVLRHIILARFVPGYEACKPPAASQDTVLPIDLHHLNLFLVSQSVPVHLYPTSALRSLFSLVPYVDETDSLAALSQAHSRLVLLLQSLVHSSQNLVIPREPSHALLFEKLSPSIPELSSPAPLLYKAPLQPPPQRSLRSALSKSKLKLLSGSTRRLSKSIFKTPSATPLPPPVAEPSALKTYSSTWRRRSISRYPSQVFSHSDSENDLVPPQRRYVSSTPTSTNSQSSLSRSSTPTPPTSNSSPSPPPSRLRFSLSPLSAPSPHDLIHALSPTRAPVLRTFVPCSSPHPHPQTIIKCEEQLIEGGLWSYLSVGDIVANLGHVPLTDEPEKPTKVSDKTRRSSTHRPPPAPPPTGNWLVFNGTFLVPFSSTPGAPVPVADALMLPSPFYYTHILPRLANPVFVLRRMPRFFTIMPDGPLSAKEPEEGDIPMRLVHLPVRVQTSRGGGVALVRRYKWLARIFVDRPADDEPELGQGWQGEWIVEGDGTKEGRETLMDWLVERGRAQGRVEGAGKGKGKEQDRKEIEWEWELVRERCRKGRMWFRLLNVRNVGEEGSETSAVEDPVGV